SRRRHTRSKRDWSSDVCSSDLQFWQTVKKGAEEKAKELGVTITFVGPDTETDVEQQVTQLQTALDKQPDALALAALDSKAATPRSEERRVGKVQRTGRGT